MQVLAVFMEIIQNYHFQKIVIPINQDKFMLLPKNQTN